MAEDSAGKNAPFLRPFEEALAKRDSLDLRRDVFPGDRVSLTTQSGSRYVFEVQEVARREGAGAGTSARGRLSGGHIARKYGLEFVDGVVVSGSMRGGHLAMDKLMQGMSVEMHVPREGKMRLLMTSPVTEILVSRGQRTKG